MATHSSILAWEIPWTEDPGGLQSMGSQRVVFLELSCFFNEPVDHPLEHLLDRRNGSFSDTEFVYFLLTNHDTMVLSK